MAFFENVKKKLKTFDLKGFLYKAASKRNSVYVSEALSLFGEVKARIIGGAALFLALIVVLASVNAYDIKIGYECYIGGERVGIVTDKQTVINAVDDVNGVVRAYTGKSGVSGEPAFVLRMVAGKDVSGFDAVREKLLSSLDCMVNCFGVYVDSVPVLGVTSEEAALRILEKYRESVASKDAYPSSVGFVEDVKIKEGHLHISLLKTPDEAVGILRGDNNIKPFEYTVSNGESLIDIAEKNRISLERILSLNGSVAKVKDGDVLKLEKAVPVLSVRAERNTEYNIETPYEVEQIKDGNLYEGTTVIDRKGKNGERKILAKVTEVNGVETSREVLNSEVLSEPVKQIEKIGTKKRPATTGSGVFIKPSFGSLSSRYGTRWERRHTGIDISGAYGSDIKAADGGIVTFSGWMDGYGNYVVINHENGYETAYGHCSELLVKEGDRVAKGDVIAKMGSTGRSTGNHLHFEVKYKGEYQDPLKYVGY